MKRFLLKALILFLPLIILSYPVDLFISNNLKQSHRYAGEIEVMKDIYEGNAGSDIAIYGSSRAWVHINPQILSDSLGLSAYNFGIDGYHFWVQYLRHLLLLEHNKKPRIIIVSVDASSLTIRKTLYQMEQFLPFMLWDKNIRKYTSRFVGFTTLDYIIPLKRYFGRKTALSNSFAFRRNRKPSANLRTRGFAGQNGKWTADVEKKLKAQRPFTMTLHDESIDLFDRFIRECKEMNIEIVMVNTPKYIEAQKIVINRDELLGMYSDFAQKYDMTFIDYSDNEICFDKNNFYNASHLNRDAANLFTSILAHDIKTQSNKVIQEKEINP